MARIHSGMSKSEVVKQLGNPQSVGGGENVEVLHYVEDKGWWQLDYYYVRLVHGKVESYGPETKQNPVTTTNPPLTKSE